MVNDVILLLSFFLSLQYKHHKILIETMEDKCVNCSQSEANSCFSRFQSNRKNSAQHFYYYQNSIKRLSANRLLVKFPEFAFNIYGKFDLFWAVVAASFKWTQSPCKLTNWLIFTSILKSSPIFEEQYNAILTWRQEVCPFPSNHS